MRSAPAFALFLAVACDRGDDTRRNAAPPPPPPPSATGSSSARADVCAAEGGGGTYADSISAPMVPRSAAGFCLDPQSEPKTYGDKGKLTMDEVCTTAFDGECEVYKRFGLDRVVVLRYVDGSAARAPDSVGLPPNSVEVSLDRFATADGAYAMFTKRVVADGDPAKATVRPFAAGAAGATSSSNAYVWRGQYLVELTFVTEDTKMTPAQMARENDRSTGAIAKEIGARLPGDAGLPPAAKQLPAAARIPLGIAYHPKQALGFASVGPIAVGYYKEGDKRWRAIAATRADADGAKETLRAFKLRAGALPAKGVAGADEAVIVMLQEAADRPKAEYVVARKGSLVAGIGDEELVIDTAMPAEKRASLELSHDEKIAKLNAWLAGGAAR